jgi:hypothetical protein
LLLPRDEAEQRKTTQRCESEEQALPQAHVVLYRALNRGAHLSAKRRR